MRISAKVLVAINSIIRIDINRCVKERVETGSIRREIALMIGLE